MSRVEPRRVYTTGRKWERMVGYARAVRVGPTIEISGCAPTADDGSTVGEGNIYEQTRQCLRVIGEALAGILRFFIEGWKAWNWRSRWFWGNKDDL